MKFELLATNNNPLIFHLDEKKIRDDRIKDI